MVDYGDRLKRYGLTSALVAEKRREYGATDVLVGTVVFGDRSEYDLMFLYDANHELNGVVAINVDTGHVDDFEFDDYVGPTGVRYVGAFPYDIDLVLDIEQRSVGPMTAVLTGIVEFSDGTVYSIDLWYDADMMLEGVSVTPKEGSDWGYMVDLEYAGIVGTSGVRYEGEVDGQEFVVEVPNDFYRTVLIVDVTKGSETIDVAVER